MSPYDGTGVDPYCRVVIPVQLDYALEAWNIRPVISTLFPVDTVRLIDVQVDNVIDALELKGHLRPRLRLQVLFEGLVTVVLDDAFPKGIQVFTDDGFGVDQGLVPWGLSAEGQLLLC